MGAIVLLEKSQRVLNALAVSPVKVFEYMTAKIVSLAFVSVLVSLILALAAGLKNIPMVLLATALTSMIFTLLGLLAAAMINSLNQYILATVPLEIVCFLPPILYLFSDLPIMRFYPLNRSMALLSGGSQTPLLDITVLLVVIVCLFAIAHRVMVKMWHSLGGVKL
jgi:fluoroquinolone transport system permease protein